MWKDWRPDDTMLWPSIVYWFGIGEENFKDRHVHYNKEEDEEQESENKIDDAETVDTLEENT